MVIKTCLSCNKWTPKRCLCKVPGYPNRGPGRCRFFDGEPGVDEVERKMNAALAAIEFAITCDEPASFLRCWLHGEFDTIRKEWADAPVTVFDGADLLYNVKKVESKV